MYKIVDKSVRNVFNKEFKSGFSPFFSVTKLILIWNVKSTEEQHLNNTVFSIDMVCLWVSHQDQFVSTQLSTPVCNGSISIHQRLFAVHFIFCLPCGQTLQIEISLLLSVNLILTYNPFSDLLTTFKNRLTPEWIIHTDFVNRINRFIDLTQKNYFLQKFFFSLSKLFI